MGRLDKQLLSLEAFETSELVCRDLAAVGHAMCVRQPPLMALALALKAAVETVKCARKQQAELCPTFSSIDERGRFFPYRLARLSIKVCRSHRALLRDQLAVARGPC